MTLHKHHIQDESALKTVLEIQSQQIVSQTIITLQNAYTEYRLQRRWLWFIFIGPMVIGGLAGFLSETLNIAEEIVLFFALLCTLGFFYGLFWHVLPAIHGLLRFSRRVDELVFVSAATVAGLEAASVHSVESASVQNDSHDQSSKNILLLFQKFQKYAEFLNRMSEPVLQQLRSSELITESFNMTTVETVCSGTVQGNLVTVAELDVKHETGSGKNRSVHEIFHGYFVGCVLKKPLAGKTFITTEQDKTGFGNLSFFRAASPQETFLEWNDFENLLHVATTNEVEARYILTPDFMADLYDWWKGQSGNIRVSFIGDRMYMLYPDKKIRIGETIKDLNESALQEHLFTIARPLLHVVHLVEDVRL